MNTIIAIIVCFLLASALCYHYYLIGYDRGTEEGANFFGPSLKELEPSEPMVPQSLVNSILEDTKKAHRDEMVGQIAATQIKAAQEFKEKEKAIRADAIKRHKNVTKGKTTEHLIPYMEEFEYNPSDCRFMGSPIDIVVFDGLSDGEVKDVVFLEIKTGPAASLSTRERKVRDAIKDGRVSWRLLRKKQS